MFDTAGLFKRGFQLNINFLKISLLYFLYVFPEKAFITVTTEVVSKDFATDAWFAEKKAFITTKKILEQYTLEGYMPGSEACTTDEAFITNH